MLTDQLRLLPTGCIAGFGVATQKRPSWQVRWNAYELCNYLFLIPFRPSELESSPWNPSLSHVLEGPPATPHDTGGQPFRRALFCKNHVHQIFTQLWVPVVHIPVHKSTASIHPTSFHAEVREESLEYLLECFILALPSFNHLELRQNWARPSVPVWPTSASGGAWSWSEAFQLVLSRSSASTGIACIPLGIQGVLLQLSLLPRVCGLELRLWAVCQG